MYLMFHACVRRFNLIDTVQKNLELNMAWSTGGAETKTARKITGKWLTNKRDHTSNRAHASWEVTMPAYYHVILSWGDQLWLADGGEPSDILSWRNSTTMQVMLSVLPRLKAISVSFRAAASGPSSSFTNATACWKNHKDLISTGIRKGTQSK